MNIKNALDDNLNTPKALAEISRVINVAGSNHLSVISEAALNDFLTILYEQLGFLLKSSRKDITGEQQKMINDREHARSAKDWYKSDALRDQLLQQGISLKDTENGAIWSRI